MRIGTGGLMLAFWVLGMASLPLTGCAQHGSSQRGYAKHDDCLFCHSLKNTGGLKDLSRMYAQSENHHKVNIAYPMTVTAKDEYHIPAGQRDDVVFFDRNGNGKPDVDEVRMYLNNGVALITCSSCHREHDRSPVRVEHPDDDYLRGTNVASELCTTCHRK